MALRLPQPALLVGVERLLRSTTQPAPTGARGATLLPRQASFQLPINFQMVEMKLHRQHQ